MCAGLNIALALLFLDVSRLGELTAVVYLAFNLKSSGLITPGSFMVEKYPIGALNDLHRGLYGAG